MASYVLCRLKEFGKDYEYIDTVILGRNIKAIQQRVSAMNRAGTMDSSYWAGRLKEKGISVPADDGLEMRPTYKRFEVSKKNLEPAGEEKPYARNEVAEGLGTVELLIDDMHQVLGPGSIITVKGNSGLMVTIKVSKS